MRENSNASMTGEAQVVDREIHQKGLEVEASIIADSIMQDLVSLKPGDFWVLTNTMMMIFEILQDHREILENPDGPKAKVLREMGHLPGSDAELEELKRVFEPSHSKRKWEFKKIAKTYSKIERGLFHFKKAEERELFLNVLFVRLSLFHASTKGIAVEDFVKRVKNKSFKVTAAQFLDVIRREYIDTAEREEITDAIAIVAPQIETSSRNLVAPGEILDRITKKSEAVDVLVRAVKFVYTDEDRVEILKAISKVVPNVPKNVFPSELPSRIINRITARKLLSRDIIDRLNIIFGIQSEIARLDREVELNQEELDRLERMISRMGRALATDDFIMRADSLAATLEHSKYIDDIGMSEIEDFLQMMEKISRNYEKRHKLKIGKQISMIRGILSRKNFHKIPNAVHSKDPEDIVGAATQGDTSAVDTSFLSQFNTRPLGEMSSDQIADNLLMQGKVGGVNSKDRVRELLSESGNWNYSTLDGEGVTQGTFTELSGEDEVEYYYISRFGKKPVFAERINRALAVSEGMLKGSDGLEGVNERIHSVIGEGTGFRMFMGSTTGYFEVIDNQENTGDSFQHVIEITVLTDDYRPLEGIEFSPDELDIIRSYFDDIEVSRISISIIGIGQVKNAFKSDSSQALEEKRNIQRLFLSLHREDLQVVGDSMIKEDAAIDPELRNFEVSYAKELIDLTHELEEDVSGIAEEEFEKMKLSEKEDAELENLDDSLQEVREQLRKINSRLKKKKGVLEEEVARLRAESDAIAEEEQISVMATEEDRSKLRERKAVHEKWTDDYHRRLGALEEEFTKLEEPAKGKENLESRVNELKTRRDRAKEIIRNSRLMELLLKKVEDAQFSLSQSVEAKGKYMGLIPGVVIDKRYRIKEVIGRGGFGVVYRVYDIRNKREAAIKILLPNKVFRSNQEEKQKLLRLFDREVNLTQRLGADGRASVPLVGDRGTYLGVPYFVMTLERGRTLEEIMKDLKYGKMRLDPRSVAILMHVISRAVLTVHSAGVILRDIKPANIMIPVNEDGMITFPTADKTGANLFQSREYRELYNGTRVMDMGIAIEGEWREEAEDIAAYRSEQEMGEIDLGPGTPEYMPAERFLDNKTPVDGRSDNYALGVILYQLLSFSHPLGENAREHQKIVVWHLDAKNKVPLLNDVIDSKNEQLKGNRKVIRTELESIEKGLTRELARVTKPGERVMVRDARLYWHEDVVDEEVLRERLRKIKPDMPAGVEDSIVAVVLKCRENNPVYISKVDGYIEALADVMLKREVSKRPTVKQVIDEVGKYLTGREEDLKYRPKGEKREWIVEGARIFQRHHKLFAAVSSIFAVVVTSVLVFVGYLYHMAMKSRKQALDDAAAAKTQMADAREKLKEAERKKSEAEKAAAEAGKRLAELNAKSKEIEGSLKKLSEEKTKLEKEKAELIELFQNQEQKKEGLNKKIKELEKKQKDMQGKEKALNESLLKLAENKDRTQAELKAQQNVLLKMKLELEKYQKSMAGVFEAAKKEMTNLNPEKAVDIVRAGVPYWRIDSNNLKMFSLGFDGVVKIAVDRKQFKAAVDLEKQRVEWLKWIQGGKSAEAKLPYVQESVKSHMNIVRLLAANGDFEAALEYASKLLKNKEFASSKDRIEQIRMAQADIYVNEVRGLDKKGSMKRVKEAESVIAAMNSEDKKNFYYGSLYFASGDHKKAVKYFDEYQDLMDKLSREKGIAQGVKSQRQGEAAYGLFMQAASHYKKALYLKEQDNKDDAADSLQSASKMLDQLTKLYPEQSGIQSYVFLMRGDLAAAAGEAVKAKESYAKAERAADKNEQGLVLMIIYERLGKKTESSAMENTWSRMVLPSSVRIPIVYSPDIKRVLDARIKELQEKVRLEIKEAEDAKLEEILKKRKGEEALKEMASLRRQMSSQIKDEATAERELTKINKAISTLNHNMGIATNKWDKKDTKRQLDRAERIKKIILEIQEMLLRRQMSSQIKDEVTAERELAKINKAISTLNHNMEMATNKGDKKDIKRQLDRAERIKKIILEIQETLKQKKPEDGKDPPGNRGKKDEQGALRFKQVPIADDASHAPDHRLVNAVLKWSMPERKFLEPDEKRGMISIMYAGDDTCNNFRDLYDKLSHEEQGRVEIDFREACRADGMPEETQDLLLREGLEQLRLVSGHAGIQRSFIYIVKGKSDIEELKEHECLELVLHQKAVAALAGYNDWMTFIGKVSGEEVRGAISRFREQADYNKYAKIFHRIAEEKVPLGEISELIPDGTSSGYQGNDRQLPIVDHVKEDEKPSEWNRQHMIDLMKGMSENVSPRVGNTIISRVKGDKKKSVIVFADEMIDNVALLDFANAAKMLGDGNEGVLDRLVLYTENPLKGDLVRDFILSHNPKAIIDIVTDEDLKVHYKKEYFKISDIGATDALLGYLTGRKDAYFREIGDILGVIRGPLSGEGQYKKMKKFMAQESDYKIPVVVFSKPVKDKAFSFKQAVQMLLEANSSIDKLSKEDLLLVLGPAIKILPELQKAYEEYTNMLEAIGSSA